jgi:hypothetical protein
MERIYWYKVDFTGNNKSLRNKLLVTNYTNESQTGFVVNTSNERYISAKYISSKTVVERTESPFGSVESVERVIYETIDFELIGENYEVLILNSPSRCIKEFLFALQEASSFEMSIDKFNINLPSLWQTLADKSIEIKRIKELELTEVVYSSKAIAKIIVKGDVSLDSYEEVMQLNQKHKLKRIKTSVSYNEASGDVEFYSYGKVCINPIFSKLLLPELKEIFTKLF